MKLLGLASAVLAAIPAVAAYKECNEGPWAKMQLVGDKHKSSKFDVEICETQWTQGAAVNGVEVWGEKKRISGIRLHYSNGQKSNMIGARKGDRYEHLEWDSSTTVRRVELWSDWDATQLGGLSIELSNDKKLVMQQDHMSAVLFSPDVGSGIMTGGFGRADDHITQWGWMFLEDKIATITIGDFKWDKSLDQLRKDKAGSDRMLIDSQVEYNIGTKPLTIHMDKKVDVKNGYSFSQSSSFTWGLGYSLEISGQALGVGAKATYSAEFKMGKETKKEWSKSDDASLSAKTIHECPPGYTSMCVGYAEFAKMDVGYESTVKITLTNGKSFEYKERGNKAESMYAKSQVKCADQEGDHTKEDPYDFVDRRAREVEEDKKKKKDEEEKKKKEGEDKNKKEEEEEKQKKKKEDEKKKKEEEEKKKKNKTPPHSKKRSGVISIPFTA